ncbi:quinol dehydrogenase ferredoxin subunit NapH [Helicobacter colisuis]|uniref:Quinol dehydrogenase ferredoxin subunit NapH n=1 Tax=Helicobacter colisuis TaxID=2949739 RepID=A0ABT0TU25_9HELI|nr:quinol dehydrogenase ferredoxin subunit NapH [Helicobacter colisuis]MCL9819423.1 quinol dehydrogenase ferredoxin subunit NapH [Helicobacter colisuis]
MMKKYRFLVLRRIAQIGLLCLYVLGNYAGIKILQGNLSGSLLFEMIPLSDPFAILQLLFSGAIVGINALVGGLIILVFYGLIVGRAFCSYICPMNLVTDLANYLRRVLNISYAPLYLSRRIRYVVLFLTLILSSLFGMAAFEAISPIGMIHRGIVFGMGFGAFAVLLVFLLDLFVVSHGFCGHLCPLGAFYSLVSKFAFLKVKYDLDSCTHCMECKKICPEKQVLGLIGKESGKVIGGECTRCGRCIEVCGDNALRFNLLDFAKKEIR